MTLVGAITIVMLVSVAHARTWRVNTAGTGDAPTVHAAMDSATASDVVLLEAGEYPMESSLDVPSGVLLLGESGPANTVLYVVFSYDPPPTTVSLLAGAGMRGVHVKGLTNTILYSHGSVVEYCILESENDWIVVEGSFTDFTNCLLIGGGTYIPANFGACIIYSRLYFLIECDVVACDVLGDVDPRIDASATYGNFSLDPRFCGIPGSGNYFLQSTSPCLGENNPFGPVGFDIGPLGVGCGTVSVEEKTWGGVKALYQDP